MTAMKEAAGHGTIILKYTRGVSYRMFQDTFTDSWVLVAFCIGIMIGVALSAVVLLLFGKTEEDDDDVSR